MHANETTSTSQIVVQVGNLEHRAKHRSRFTSVKDSRNRKVRGLWRRGEKLYRQTRVAEEKSARRISRRMNRE
jgi:hypothetical protein